MSDAPSVLEIDIAELVRRREQQTLCLIDVREPDEYEAGHVPGAVLVPLGEVPARVAEFPTDETTFLVCRSGARSMRAAEFLAEHGLDVVNVGGGTLAWVEAGHPVDVGFPPS